VGENVSAAPDALAAFDAAASDAAGALLRHSRLLDAALAGLARTHGVGLTALPSDLGRRLGAHARHLADLGSATGRVGAAFAAAGSGARGGVVQVHSTAVEELLERWGDSDAALGQLPDDAPALVPGANGCPAVAVPIWFRRVDREDRPEIFDEPLWTGLQTRCDSEPVAQQGSRTAATQTGLVAGQGGITMGAGQIVEARGRRGPRPAPAPAPPRTEPPSRVLTMPPSLARAWADLDRYRGSVRTSGRGRKQRFYTWDHTHGHIEVFDHDGRHLGTAGPTTLEPDPTTAVRGRRLED
jgi:Cytotoxic